MKLISCQRAMRVRVCHPPGRFDTHCPSPKRGRGVAVQLAISLLLLFAATLPAVAQRCSQPLNTQFYQDHGYTIRKIEFKNPLDFLFLVHHQLQKLKDALPIAEKQPFSKTNYDASAELLEKAVKSDDSFGNSPAKVVMVSASIQNCQEEDTAPKTVDVVYHIFSTDPLLSVRALPEKRQDTVEEPATAAAEENTKAYYKIRPLLGYEDARRGYGGIDLRLKIPGQIFDGLHLSASGSPTSRTIDFQLDGSKVPNLRALERAEYHLAYNYSKLPVSNLRLAEGSFQARFIGFSKPFGTDSSPILLRYGASVELGNQQSNLTATIPPSGTITNSAYGAIRAYAGITKTTRYSEITLSYGLQIGGAGLDDLSFSRHIGDIVYSRRFPARTHSPWDIQARFSLGGITGSRGILINDRFFGGNSVTPFIPGDAWFIPGGPIVRSIPSNRLNGGGFGGTSFYSTNLTIGKVIIFEPLIPREVEEADGFDSGVRAGENTAEGYFFDYYLASTPEYQTLTIDHAKKLKEDLTAVQATFTAIRATGAISPSFDKILKKAESLARLSQNIIRRVIVPEDQTSSQKLAAFLNPDASLLLMMLKIDTTSGLQALPCGSQPSVLKSDDKPGLLVLLCMLQPLVSTDAASQLATAQGRIMQDLAKLRVALDDIKRTPVGLEAAAHAHRDMIRPREIIDALRHEVNSYSFSLVGIFDSGRIWPDLHGTRYAIGGGGRFSLLNVNFTLGYAVNPQPRMELGQGRGALVFSLTYTNLFR
jgi:hypothetical protein